MKSRLTLMLGAEAVVIAALLTLALDQDAHKRVQGQAGVNGRGYRGDIVHARSHRETRIAVVGGDYAFGWGMTEAETTTGYLRTMMPNALNASGVEATAVSAVNLGALGLPARDYASRIEQFRYLDPDVLCLYVDLADNADGSVMPPFDSGIAQLVGYVPMLPLVIEEKGFTTVGRTLRSLDRSLYHLVARAPARDTGDRTAAIERAMDVSLGIGRLVLVVIPVPLNPAQELAHAKILASANARALTQSRLAVVDLGAEPRFAVPGLRLDGVSYSAGGNSLVAQEVGRVIAERLSKQKAS